MKFYSFSKNEEQLPNKEDDLKGAIEKIKKIVNIFPKYDEITYDELVDFLLGLKKNNFIKMENKIDYLLSFLDLKSNKLSDIKNKYKEIKNKVGKKINKIKSLIDLFSEESDSKKKINF